MTSEKQIVANQINAQKGGVKTEEGKSRSRQNARKHGVLSNAIQKDEIDTFKSYLEALQEEFSPNSYMEDTFVEDIAHYRLKLYRLRKAECEYITASIDLKTLGMYPPSRDSDNTVPNIYEPLSSPSTVEILSDRYQRYATNLENRIYRALKELRSLKK